MFCYGLPYLCVIRANINLALGSGYLLVPSTYPKGKPYLGYSFTRKATTHWEWRDGENSLYPPNWHARRWSLYSQVARNPF